MIEYLTHQIETDLWGFIGRLGLLVSLFIWWGTMVWMRKAFFRGMWGEDGIGQFIEWSGVLWMTFAPPMIVAASFNVELPAQLWAFMEFAFILNILGKSAGKYIEARYGVPQGSSKTESKIEITKTETKQEKKQEEP